MARGTVTLILSEEQFAGIYALGYNIVSFSNPVEALNWMSRLRNGEIYAAVIPFWRSEKGLMGSDIPHLIRTGVSEYGALRDGEIQGLSEMTTRIVSKNHGFIPMICYGAKHCESALLRAKGIYLTSSYQVEGRHFKRAEFYRDRWLDLTSNP